MHSNEFAAISTKTVVHKSIEPKGTKLAISVVRFGVPPSKRVDRSIGCQMKGTVVLRRPNVTPEWLALITSSVRTKLNVIKPALAG